ncbi:MAG: hypothetical protein ACLU3D_11000 [Acutalibacteraceae bacterium]|jgi:hypothetical protein
MIGENGKVKSPRLLVRGFCVASKLFPEKLIIKATPSALRKRQSGLKALRIKAL